MRTVCVTLFSALAEVGAKSLKAISSSASSGCSSSPVSGVSTSLVCSSVKRTDARKRSTASILTEDSLEDEVESISSRRTLSLYQSPSSFSRASQHYLFACGRSNILSRSSDQSGAFDVPSEIYALVRSAACKPSEDRRSYPKSGCLLTRALAHFSKCLGSNVVVVNVGRPYVFIRILRWLESMSARKS